MLIIGTLFFKDTDRWLQGSMLYLSVRFFVDKCPNFTSTYCKISRRLVDNSS